MELILASLSPYRRALLERLGIPFECVRPPFDEEVFKNSDAARTLTPHQLAEGLALRKAESVAADRSHAVVIGGDQLVEFQGEVLGKPGSLDGAIEQLLRMSGQDHRLITAIAICHRGESRILTDVTKLRMRPLTRLEIERYVTADCPTDCAGSYKIEGRGIALFEQIDSVDQTAIIGLPLIALTSQLREYGFEVP